MLPLLRSIVKGPVAEARNWFRDPNYRKWSLLQTAYRYYPRHKEFRTRLAGFPVMAPDSASFLSSYKDIFLGEIYSFEAERSDPFILDLGANIGLSVIYFKQLYPNARVVALEPDPVVFHYLQKNVRDNALERVELLNKAAWKENTSLNFNSTGDDAGRVAFDTDRNLLTVEAIEISPFLESRVDLLKMDVEGAEHEILEACKDRLYNVERVVLEYHSRANEAQHLDRILQILRDAGFRVHVLPVLTSPHPFMEVEVVNGFDLQLDLFAWRPAKHPG